MKKTTIPWYFQLCDIKTGKKRKRIVNGFVGVYLFLYSTTMEYDLFRGGEFKMSIMQSREGKEKTVEW